MRLLPLSAAVRPYDHILLDLDGCLWVGDQALVLTGGASRVEAEAADPSPTFIADSLGALVLPT